MGKKEHLVEGAVLMCINGSKKSMLKVPVGHGYTSGGKKKANCKDCKKCVNISYFGNCSKNKKTHICEGFMNLAEKWENITVSLKEPEKIDGEAVITMDSVLLCKKGGIIIPVTSGQGYGIGENIEKLKEKLQKAIQWIRGKNLICCIFGKDPINLNTGNYIYEKEALVIPGIVPLSFRIFYNSMEDGDGGCIGSGWHHNYEMHVRYKDDEKRVYLCLADGRELPYCCTPGDIYVPLFGNTGLLKKKTNGFLYCDTEGVEYIFDKGGQLVSRKEKNGNVDSFIYNEENQLIEVAGANGGKLVYIYNKEGNLICVKDHAGREVQLWYRYRKLWKFVNASGYTYVYDYNENGKLESVVTPRGIMGVFNEYDSVDRVVKQTLPDGSVAELAYDDEHMRSYVKEPNGSMVIHERDERYRNIKNIYGDGEENFAYNDNNQLTLYVDKNGNTTKYNYCGNGNLTEIIDALGNRMRFSYDESNHLTRTTFPDGSCMKDAYDREGNLIQRVDQSGNSIYIAYNIHRQPECILQPDGSKIGIRYDERGNITGITDAMGNCTGYEYDSLNRIVAVTDGNGNRTGFIYNAQNDIERVINALGQERKYEYTPSGKVTSVSDYDGYTIKIGYDSSNRIERYEDKEGNTIIYKYDLMGNLEEERMPNGGIRFFSYDLMNRLDKYTDEVGSAVQYRYDANGNCIEKVGADGAVTVFSYDALNRVTKVTECDGLETSYEYNPAGQITRVVYSNGETEEVEYDICGRESRIKDIYGNITVYEYNSMGNVKDITNGMGGKTTLDYYPGGLLQKVEYPDGTSEEFTYDGNGNITERKNKTGYIVQFSYDSLNRVIAVNSNIGEKTEYEYDAVGNVILTIDGKGNTRSYEYSPNGNLTSVTDAEGYRTIYGYDCMGNVVSVEQEGQHITCYERDVSGRLTAITDALGNRETYDYDCNGRIVKKTDREGYETIYAYSLWGDISRIGYADGRSVEYEYNSLRQLICVKDWLGKTCVEPDQYGRAVSVTDYNGKNVRYQYGSMGERRAISYPDGGSVEYKYDNCMRLTGIHVEKEKADIAYHYDENGYLAEKILPGGVTAAYRYDKTGRITGITNRDYHGIMDELEYTYDAVGNKSAMRKKRRGISKFDGEYSFLYDKENRLTGVMQDGNLIRKYMYDRYGNRIHKQGEKGTESYLYNITNQLVRMEGDAGKEYAYDKRGNLTGIWEKGIQTSRYEYDATNRITCAIVNGRNYSRYIYNGMGQRVGIENGIETAEGNKQMESGQEYILDLTAGFHNLLQEEQKGTGEKRNYIWDDGVLLTRDGNSNRYYLRDELGSPIRLLYRNGNLSEAYDYDEFGNLLYGQLGEVQPFGFTGYRKDTVSDSYYAQAREYLPWEGRFAAQDVIGQITGYPQTVNGYVYCYDNPIIYIDKDGRFPLLVTAAAGGLIGGVIGGGGSILSDVIHGREIDWKKAGKNALIGAGAGAVVGSGVGLIGGALSSSAVLAGAVNGCSTIGITAGTIINTMQISAGIGGALTSGYEIAKQIKNDEEIDMIKAGIKGAEGAGSGMLMGSPIGFVGSILGNAAISAASSFAYDSYEGKDIKTKGINCLWNGLWGGIGGAIGGRGVYAGNVYNVTTYVGYLHTEKIIYYNSLDVVKKNLVTSSLKMAGTMFTPDATVNLAKKIIDMLCEETE